MTEILQAPGVPKHEMHEFHAKTAPYALIIGVYNEGEKFTRQLAALQPYRNLVDIIIADGASNDGATAADAVQRQARTLLIHKEDKRGLSMQYRGALYYALEQGYAGVIMMDGNGKDGVEALPQFIDALNDGADFVQGSRFMRGGEHRNTPLDRVIGIRYVFNPIMFLASGFHYSDAMNGFKACSCAFLSHPGLQLFRDVFVGYNLQYYLNYRAPKLGIRPREIPVSRCYHDENTPHSKIIGIRARLGILKELAGVVMGCCNPR